MSSALNRMINTLCLSKRSKCVSADMCLMRKCVLHYEISTVSDRFCALNRNDKHFVFQRVPSVVSRYAFDVGVCVILRDINSPRQCLENILYVLVSQVCYLLDSVLILILFFFLVFNKHLNWTLTPFVFSCIIKPFFFVV